MAFVYFMYSEEQVNEKNKILAGMSKTFQPGVVVVGNKRERFSQMSTDDSIMKRFVDMKIVASGEQSSFTYKEPQNVEMRGNNV